MRFEESINNKIKISICAAVLLAAISVHSDPVVSAQECVKIAVSGTLMRGLELQPNSVNLTSPQARGAAPVSGAAPQGGGQQQPQQLARPQGSTFIREDRTTPEYRLYSINDMHTAMVRVPANATNGVSVVVDIWCVPSDRLATLLEQEPPGLSIGKVRLIHNSTVLGVIAEPALLVGMKDISNFDGNWREYIAKTGLQLIDNATQSANLTSDQKAAIKQLRSEGELLAQNGQFRGAIDSLNTAIKMLGLKDRLYLNIPLRSTAP